MLGLCFALAFAGATMTPNSLMGISDGNDVTIRWSTMEESDMAGKQFEIRREGVSIGSVPAKGNPSDYLFLDLDAFKSTGSTYHYQIFVDGAAWSAIVSVSHSTSSVKRTWGSLKAMFR